MEPRQRSNWTDAFIGYTIIRRIEFFTELTDGSCTLVIELSRTVASDADVICAKFVGVSGLCIKKIGGGISQFLFLIVEDIKDQQLDRLNYKIYEAERGAISFFCHTIDVRSN